jgi:hypothetical protein
MATTPGIVTRRHMDDILALVRRSGLDADVEVVPSIQEWCKQRGVPEESPFRTGKTLKNMTTGRHLILLPDLITDEMASSVRYAMEFRGFTGAAQQLADPLTFLRHLVLHEIAHGLDGDRSEQDCDRWAFEQLKALPSNNALVSDTSAPALRTSCGAPQRER